MTSNALLEIRNINMRFGGLRALNNVNLELYPGELIGLIGPNGAGKTTLFNIVSGVYKPNNGQVLFKGFDITHLPAHKRCRLGIGRTSQIPKPFFTMSVLENVTVGALFGYHGQPQTLIEAQERAMVSLERINFISHKDKEAGILTLGEQKKLDLARALATQPSLLLLDEVLAGLNGIEILDILDIIHNICESGIAVLMIEHIVDVLVKISERIIVLHNGGILADGAPSEIIKYKRVIKAYFGDINLFD